MIERLRVKLRTRPWRGSRCEQRMRLLGAHCPAPADHLLP